MTISNITNSIHLNSSQKKTFARIDIDIGYVDIVADTTANGRFYHCPNGQTYPSITTVCAFRGSEFLEAWRNRVGKAEADRISRIATTSGSELHLMTEKYLRGEDVPVAMPLEQNLFNQCKRVLDESVGSIYLQEFPLYSQYLKVAGRVDVVAEFDGKLAIIDFKTSKREKKRDEIHKYFIQECFYAIAFEELTGKPINRLVTIMPVEGRREPLLFVEKRKDWDLKLQETINDYYSNRKVS